MTPPLRVLVAGCGYVGTRLGLLLAESGLKGRPVEVFGLRRDPSGLPEPLRPVAADLLAPDLASRIPQVDHVVYAASADGGDEAAYRRVYDRGVDALLRILEARPEAGPDMRFVFVSSTGVYGDTGGEEVDEDSPTEPESFRGETMLAGEARVLASPLHGIVLRLGGIYGPGRTRLLEMVRSGRARCPGDGPIWSNRIHRDDAAAAAAHLLSLPEPAPIYLGVDAEPAPLCQVYRWVAEALGVQEPPVDPDTGRDRSNKRCSSRRLQASGFAFRYPSFREGYGAMIREEAP